MVRVGVKFHVLGLTFHVTDPFPFGTSPNLGEERGGRVEGFMNLFYQQDRTYLDRCFNPYNPCHRVDGIDGRRIHTCVGTG